MPPAKAIGEPDNDAHDERSGINAADSGNALSQINEATQRVLLDRKVITGNRQLWMRMGVASRRMALGGLGQTLGQWRAVLLFNCGERSIEMGWGGPIRYSRRLSARLRDLCKQKEPTPQMRRYTTMVEPCCGHPRRSALIGFYRRAITCRG